MYQAPTKIKPDAEIKKIVSACFPAYKGRKYAIGHSIPRELRSYWDEGSKDTYCFYNLLTSEVLPVQTNHPCYESGKPSLLASLPEHIMLVEHTIFCGRDCGITLYNAQWSLQQVGQ